MSSLWGRPGLRDPLARDPFRNDVEMACDISPIAKRPAPRIPRQHYTPPTGRPVIAFIVVALCAVLCAMGIVDIAGRIDL